MSTPQHITVRVSRRIAASPERAFDAFLDPKKAGRFMFATPAGQMVRAEIDPRVGGAYTFVDRRNGEDAVHTGKYLEIDRPRRLAFTFSTDESEGDRVVIDIVRMGNGCEVTLTHEMKPEWADFASRVESGWAGILEGLAATVG